MDEVLHETYVVSLSWDTAPGAVVDYTIRAESFATAWELAGLLQTQFGADEKELTHSEDR